MREFIQDKLLQDEISFDYEGGLLKIFMDDEFINLEISLGEEKQKVLFSILHNILNK